uniref:Uncharacterized protein n=1 Tax=Tetranychus urticae TaxID=32264 RepID=T1JUY3_TETUR
MRRITDYTRSSLAIEQAEEKLRDRGFIIKMNALVHNQLSAPAYKPMLIYAWQKSGYKVTQEISEFKSVLEVNFANFDDPCVIEQCANRQNPQLHSRFGCFPC